MVWNTLGTKVRSPLNKMEIDESVEDDDIEQDNIEALEPRQVEAKQSLPFFWLIVLWSRLVVGVYFGSLLPSPTIVCARSGGGGRSLYSHFVNTTYVNNSRWFAGEKRGEARLTEQFN
jgi:hypothetical protein